MNLLASVFLAASVTVTWPPSSVLKSSVTIQDSYPYYELVLVNKLTIGKTLGDVYFLHHESGTYRIDVVERAGDIPDTFKITCPTGWMVLHDEITIAEGQQTTIKVYSTQIY